MTNLAHAFGVQWLDTIDFKGAPPQRDAATGGFRKQKGQRIAWTIRRRSAKIGNGDDTSVDSTWLRVQRHHLVSKANVCHRFATKKAE
jgi:hypothetical protein